jgi:hypothetical protein
VGSHSDAWGDTVPQHTVEQYPVGGGESSLFRR